MLKPTYVIPKLPPPEAIETRAVLRHAAKAHRQLAELKGRAAAIPNQGILIDSLNMQEAQASSEIESIVTTQDEIFQHSSTLPLGEVSPAMKEVALYAQALKSGYEIVRKKGGLITNNAIIEMFQTLKRTNGGFRDTSGTALKNETTGELVYIPPQSPDEVRKQMNNLESFINDDSQDELDPLVKMAIIHHQFESIHPFPDGNGRIGRMINVIYLTKSRLLDIPILYLSRYFTQNKSEYYHRLQAVRDNNNWEPWILYMLHAVKETAASTLELVEGIRQLMAEYKNNIRSNHPKIYSQDLLNNLFRHPYTRIEFIQNDLGVSRQTASKYLDELVNAELLQKHVVGRNNYYVNRSLVELFIRVSNTKMQ